MDYLAGIRPEWMQLTDLEVVDGVRRGEPGGARVLLGAEGPVEGLGDGAQVEGAHRRCCNTVAFMERWTWKTREGRERQEGTEKERGREGEKMKVKKLFQQ